jgi:hypothetical protein
MIRPATKPGQAADSWRIPRLIPRSIRSRNSNGFRGTMSGETGNGGVWNMVFVGVSNPAVGNLADPMLHVHHQHPADPGKARSDRGQPGQLSGHGAEKNLQTDSFSITWSAGPTRELPFPSANSISRDRARTMRPSINAALNSGLNPDVHAPAFIN